MKTAGYDIALLINERLLNELSAAFYYGGFMTVNGTVDFYNSKISLENQIVKMPEQELLILDKESLPINMKSYLIMDYRFKLTREPMINFVRNLDNTPTIQLSLGCRIYFFMWQSFEVKFDTNITISVPIFIDPKTIELIVDFKNAVIDDLNIKYGKNMLMEVDLRLIINKALNMYFSDKTICQEIKLPCMSSVIKDLRNYIQYQDEEGNNLGIIPTKICAMRVVSDTVMAVGINLMDYTGGNPEELHDFARNCSMGIAISEKCMQKVYQFCWDNSCFTIYNDDKNKLVLVKKIDSASVSLSGNVDTKSINNYWSKANNVLVAVQKGITKLATAGLVESSISVDDIQIGYGVEVKINGKPEFELLGDNVVRLYNINMDITLSIDFSALFEYKIEIDTSGFIPDSWTPWEDDITIARKRKRITIFSGYLHMPNADVRDCRGRINWNEKNQSLELEVLKLDIYWNLKKKGSPFMAFPEKLLNYLSDKFEALAVKKLKPIAVSPKLEFDVKNLPWSPKLTGRKLEVTGSEVIVSANFSFDVFNKDVYPVPKYIANTNNMEIHKIGCDSVNDTYEVHQRNYHLLIDGLNAGYDGCQKCLPAFHKK